MPIEIKELIVKVNIQESFHNSTTKNTIDKKALQNLKKEIIKECLGKMKDLLDKQRER
jgi:hypothetical protein